MTLAHQRFILRFCVFNFALLMLVLAWFWRQNQPISMPEPNLPDGKMQCISYSPYYKEGVTPLNINTHISHEQIDQDLTALSQRFNCVRIYSVSQGLDYVPEAASKLGMKVYLGAWIGWVKKLTEKEVNLAISLANKYPDTIKAVIVGNEVLLRGEQSEAKMKAYIERVKQAVHVPVTYADVWEFWRKHPKLEESVDFVTVHILPYWEDKPQPIESAVDHTQNVMRLLGETFHKPILIGETGWPTTGRQRQGALPSSVNQALYIRSFLQVAQDKHWQYNLIEAFDQPWKRNLEGTVGGYWGIFDTHFTPKFSLSGSFAERHDGLKLALYALTGAVLFLMLAFYIKATSKQTLLASALLGALLGCFALLQAEYLLAACRTQREWLSLGGLVLTGWIAIICLPIYAFTGNKKAKNIMQLALIVFLLAALTANYLLIVDGRYRDFAISLYALPIIELSLGLLMLNQAIRNSASLFKLLSLALVVSASICVYTEPSNHLAWTWLAINLLLAVANWPKTQTITKN